MHFHLEILRDFKGKMFGKIFFENLEKMSSRIFQNFLADFPARISGNFRSMASCIFRTKSTRRGGRGCSKFCEEDALDKAKFWHGVDPPQVPKFCEGRISSKADVFIVIARNSVNTALGCVVASGITMGPTHLL